MSPYVVSIVSGGPSAKEVDLAAVPGFVIGVNNAALHMPKIDAAVTMDRRWTEAAWPFFLEKAGAIKLWLRPNNILKLKRLPEWKPDWVNVYQCDHTQVRMSDEPNKFHGNNSGGVALNLAYQMAPKKLFLFGFDYTAPGQSNHWFANGETGRVGDYPIHAGRYGGWARQFDECGPQFKAKGIQVINVSAFSVVTAFRKITPKAYVEGLY